ncbi:MAG TPA: Bax inhibitor-1 family protein, partial [Nitrososphaera sp.]|nr:Bax inhibitor-1 family protein [Nitrososphaera sp.]
MPDSELRNPVWDRRHDYTTATMSRRLYLLLICSWTTAGVALSAYTASISQSWQTSTWNIWMYLGFLVVVLAVAIGGTAIANHSDSVAVSAFGYALVAGPFGLLLGPFVAMYETSSVVKVFALTALVVFVLGLIGAILPDNLSSWGVPLFGALLLLLGGYLVVPLLGFFGIPIDGAMTLIDWVALVV